MLSRMFAVHAIVLDPSKAGNLVFFGKGQRTESAVRSRLRPEHEGAQILFGSEIATKTELDLRHLMLIECLRRDYPWVHGYWWPMAAAKVRLYLAAATLMHGEQPRFPPSAEALTDYAARIGVDQGAIGAMIGSDRSRVCRLMQGKGKLTLDDVRALRWWSIRLGALEHFDAAFPMDPAAVAIEAGAVPDAPGPF